jgi:ketosteroid isomerase-like protein
MDSRSVVASFLACWSVQDLEMAVAHAHPDVVYTIHNGRDASPLAGVYRGPEACRDLGYAMLAEFDYLAYEPAILAVEDHVVRAHVNFRYRHRATGNIIEGSRRLVFEIRDDLIHRLDSYEDTLRLEAFMRMSRETRATAPDLLEPFNLKIGRQKSGAGA